MMSRLVNIAMNRMSARPEQPACEERASQRGVRGFTLTETLLALLIVVILTGIVATGVPVALNAYRNVVDDSNAQLALSTTASALRDELGLAVDGKTVGGVTYYQTSEGKWATIINGDASKAGLVKRVYSTAAGSFNFSNPGAYVDVDLIPSEAIKGSTGGAGLRVQMVKGESDTSFITYNESSGVFTVKGIEVLVGGRSGHEKIENYKVKRLFDFDA